MPGAGKIIRMRLDPDKAEPDQFRLNPEPVRRPDQSGALPAVAIGLVGRREDPDLLVLQKADQGTVCRRRGIAGTVALFMARPSDVATTWPLRMAVIATGAVGAIPARTLVQDVRPGSDGTSSANAGRMVRRRAISA